ncbi:MAG TPA: hypothetical protein VJV78_41765 [Polyangiales bacterium]|nr:hypothetical protein [Polyangiales bacterium]
MSSEERGSALLVLSLGLLVPLVWLALGWRWHLLVGGNDLSLLLVPAMRRLLAVGGDFDAFLYDPAWLGGSELRDILGELPLHRLLAAWPIDAVVLLNLTAFFAQLLYGHLAARSAHALCCLAAEGGGVSWPAQLLIGLCSAFAPIIGWRIGYGHLYILFGALALPAACALVLLVRAERLTITCAAICLLAFTHALPHVGQQPVLYGALFGLPLLAALLFATGPRRHALRAAAVLALTCAAALLCTLPTVIGLWQQFAGSDLPRGIRGEGVTYSYLVASARDWLGSLLWALPDWTGRPKFTWHETNYPLGALVLALALWPRRALGLGVPVALALSAALVFAFSMDLRPVSSLLLWLVPPLGMFRVPARAALPLVLAVSPLLLGLFVARLPERIVRRDADLAVGALAVWIGTGFLRELCLWFAVALTLFEALRRPARAYGSLALLALLAVSSTLAFRGRLLELPSREALIDQPRELGDLLRRELPELASPLVRSVSGPDPKPNNTLYALGLSSLSGYNLLNQRMLRLYCALLGVPYQSGVSVISVDPGAAYFAKLAALYDIVARVHPRAGHIEPLPRLGSPLWFSERFVMRSSFEDLVQQLDAHDLRRTAAIVSSDRAASALPRVECHSEPHDIPYSVSPGPRIIVAQLTAARSADCPLTISLNYSADFRAFGRAAGGAWSPLRTYPAYGALLGVLVPRDIRELEVRMDPERSIAGSAAVVLGLLLAAGLLVYARRSQRRISRN